MFDDPSRDYTRNILAQTDFARSVATDNKQ